MHLGFTEGSLYGYSVGELQKRGVKRNGQCHADARSEYDFVATTFSVNPLPCINCSLTGVFPHMFQLALQGQICSPCSMFAVRRSSATFLHHFLFSRQTVPLLFVQVLTVFVYPEG